MAVRQPAIRSSLFTEEPLAHEGVRHPPRPHTGNMSGEGVFWPLCPCQPQLSVESAEASCSSTALLLGPCHAWTGYPKSQIRHPASCPLAAGQARALAGWPRACIQSVSDLCMMHA